MFEVDKKELEEAYEAFEKNWAGEHDIEKEYLEFSRFIQSLFIHKNEWLILTGNYQCVNYELMWEIKNSIEKHPFIWRFLWKYFMVR